ncbi:acyltransferase family protein [Mycolicibacterium sp. BiH015]|uniref:acyltransferase family protein n=1 Tax=Mycolicibacterium sp. BiH015 TaxID=3018808 RepID=UPI0022DEE3A2|nr:acyltransferase family protein [Mycolicibacterium sp. BiH015]MDA2895493.1 acyltransferase family protein [Mycolicibacterium sp. BiH015]
MRRDRRNDGAGFRADIEGLRAVAVLAVVLFHAEIPGFSGGFIGVDVFFVISGFLITGLLWREVSTTGTVRLAAFYGARARRLLPASAAVGVITMIASVIVLPPLLVPTVLWDGIASAMYVSNYRFMLDGVDYFNAAPLLPPSPFLHYWSLGVEEQFYLGWAPMILGATWLARRFGRRRAHEERSSVRPYVVVLVLIGVSSFALSYAATYTVTAVAFYSLPTRAWQLVLGGLLALSTRRWHGLNPLAAAIAGWMGLALILLSCVMLSPATVYPGTAALLPALGAVLVIAAGCLTPTVSSGQLLGLPPLRALGRISYSWYLWHWPVLVILPVALGQSLGLTARLGAALLSAGLAWLTLRCLENPVRFSPAVRTSPRRSLMVGATVTAIAVAVGAALFKAVPTSIGNGPPAPTLAVTAAPVSTDNGMNAYDAAVRQAIGTVKALVRDSADIGPVPSNLAPPLADAAAEEDTVYLDGCMRNLIESDQPECVTGVTTSTTTVTLVGDSHAAMWGPAFAQAATDQAWRLQTFAKMGCPLLDLPAASPFVRGEYTACRQWRTRIIDRLRAEPPDLVVLSMWRGYGTGIWQTGFRSYDSAWTDSVKLLVRQLRAMGSAVLVLGPIPDPHSVVPVCLSAHLDNASACAPERSSAMNGPGIAAEAVATEAGGGQYAKLTDLFCAAERCPVIVGNTLVYFDWNHLSHEYARALAPVMATLANRALAVQS